MTLRSIAIRRLLQYSDTPRIAEVLNEKLTTMIIVVEFIIFTFRVHFVCKLVVSLFATHSTMNELYERRKVKFRWMFRCFCFKPILVNRVVATFFFCAIIEASALFFQRKQNFMSAALRHSRSDNVFYSGSAKICTILALVHN